VTVADLGEIRSHVIHVDPSRVLRRWCVDETLLQDHEDCALGNRVAAMWATLPVGVADPVERLHRVSGEMKDVKQSGQAVGAEILTRMSGFAPPTIMAQAARLQARQRLFNLVVTNVPGPQFPLYLLGRKLEAIYPMVPLAENTALGIAILSYNGQLDFGLVADYDTLADVEALADELHASIEELAAAAGAPAPAAPPAVAAKPAPDRARAAR